MTLTIKNIIFFKILFLCFSINLASQTLEEFKSFNSIVPSHKEVKESPILKSNRLSPFYDFCDADGFVVIDINQIELDVLAEFGLGPEDNEAVVICTEYGDVFKINSPSSNSAFITEVCTSPQSFSDIAIDREGNYFTTNFSSIFNLDPLTCGETVFFNFGWGSTINSLSYDTNGNLYYGDATELVYRYDEDELTSPYVWHDFGVGRSGGDFVMLNGKLYISWVIDSSYRLYEVTVDSDINYVSHIDLGEIPDKTYGLASEFGRLYGVTPNSFYSIELEAFNFTTIIQNDGAYGNWWGAAGLHEAIEIETSTYLTYNNAENEYKPFPEFWINTIEGGQIVYVLIKNITTGEAIITPVTINIYKTPQISKPNDLNQCTYSSMTIFNLAEVENELLNTVRQDVEVSYFTKYTEAEENENPVDLLYENIFENETIFVRVQNTNNSCYAITDFKLITDPFPKLESIEKKPSLRLLTNCYMSVDNQAYFDLTEIYNEIILFNQLDIEIEFYLTYNDGVEGVNQIDSIYYVTKGIKEEIFIKIINETGCMEVTNFYIDGNCISYKEDISEIHFPSFFTPNNDSNNDYWNVQGISQELRTESMIYIYNRYGKLMDAFRPSSKEGWDGLYKGEPLPTNDYWFKITTSRGLIFNGHFALVR